MLTGNDVGFDGIKLDAVVSRRSPGNRPQRLRPADFPQIQLFAACGEYAAAAAASAATAPQVDAGVYLLAQDGVDGFLLPLYRLFPETQLRGEEEEST